MLTDTAAAWIPVLMSAAERLQRAAEAKVAELQRQCPDVFAAHEAEMFRTRQAYRGEFELTVPDLVSDEYLAAAQEIVRLATQFTGFPAQRLLHLANPERSSFSLPLFAYRVIAGYLAMDVSPLGGDVQERKRVTCASIVQALLENKTRGTKHNKLPIESVIGLYRHEDWCGAALRLAACENPGFEVRFDYTQHYRIRPADVAALRAWSQGILDNAELI